MPRAEFTKATKRAAYDRAKGRCEASGSLYGRIDTPCGAPLKFGAEYDHVILDANSHDNSLENCAAVCPRCHKWKTANHDTPLAAKTLRQQDKNRGIRKTSKPMQKLDPKKWRKIGFGQYERRNT